jgi:formylglycine-generating enzyme required for sulfatase activity
MGMKGRRALWALTLAMANILCAHAQLRPEATTPPAVPAATKPAQIVIQTSPKAQVYLDDVFKGQASEDGRLVIANPQPGERELRVSLAGKKDFRQSLTIVAGKEVKITATLVAPPATAAPKPARPAGPAPGQVRVNPKDGLKYVWISPGTFAMGCSPGDKECFDNEKPSHRVTITKGFWIGQTAVTVAAYKKFVGSTGAKMPTAPDFNADWKNPNMPIVDVSWDDATAFCGWAGGRLPTEAEWEYAARAGSTEGRYGPLDDVAWCLDNSEKKTHDVGQKRPNGFGLYDVLGNVWQWVNDWFAPDYYQNSPSQDPAGPSGGKAHGLRGGSAFFAPRFIRVSTRHKGLPNLKVIGVGIRCDGQVFAP